MEDKTEINEALDYVSLSLKTYNELYEKAKKWDELVSQQDDLPF